MIATADPVQSEMLATRDIAVQSVEGPPIAGLSEGTESRRLSEPAVARSIDLPARPLIAQIAQAMKSAAEGMVEVRLSPEELGRVRLSMTAGEGCMTVHVLAERPETLDLLRRHIDLLATDLHEQGFGDIDFSFGQDRESSHATGDMPTNNEDGDQVTRETPTAGAAKSKLALEGRLDIRL